MRVLITGSNGFIGKNLKLNLTQHRIKIETFEKGENINNLKKKIEISDTIIHLAGTNVSRNKLEFNKNNFSFSKKICDILKKSNKKKNFFFASTEQCKQKKKTSYIRSKLKAEKEILKLKNNKNVQICIARLPNIFGKFCKPNYNSFIATCCNNLIKNKQIKIYNPNRIYNLMHIDDLNDQIMNTFIKRRNINKRPFMNLKKIYKCKAENLYKKINFFNKNYKDIILENLTAGLDYKLFSTFVSYLDKKKVSYKTKLIEDQNGSFSEFSRNKNFGQISILSIKPNQTRGNHFHNLKVEKFQLINGKATFFFKSMMTKKKFSVNMNSNRNNLIYSIPGYLHSIKNISKHKIHFVIWSNQLFNKKKPDTFKI